MKKKYLLIFATSREAKDTIERFKAVPMSDGTGFFWERGVIILSGIGLHAAQMSVAGYAPRCDEVLNIGFAGALNHDLSLGEIVEIKKVEKFVPYHSFGLDPQSIEYMTAAVPSLSLMYGDKTLVTSDFPIHDVKTKLFLAQHGDLVDMEGYGVAHASNYFEKPCRLWKIVSDFSSQGGRDLIIKNWSVFSKKIADHMENIIHASCIDS